MKMHSIEHRFVAIVCGAVVLFVAPLFVLFLSLSSERVAREQLSYTRVILTANAQALGKPLWDFDKASARRIAETMLDAKNVAGVSISGLANTFKIQIPPDESVGVDKTKTKLSADIIYNSATGEQKVGTLTIRVDTPGMFARFGRDEISILIILLMAVGIVFAAAIVGNRFTIIRPLLHLTEAIKATRQLGSRRHVNWFSNDEMGTLAANFNDMQSQLEAEERQLQRAHQRATDIYNRTPAMLYSLNRENELIAVSDYWLEATGYTREAVIGKDFTDFISTDSRREYQGRKIRDRPGDHPAEVTVQFIRADGSEMSVLILETHTHGVVEDGQISLSVMTDVSELKKAELRNHRQAITDHLTGLLNRQGFESVLNKTIEQVDQSGLQLACVFIDLDRFKWINDTFGHASGDAVLRETVHRIKEITSSLDPMSRLGGDEFAILIADTQAEHLALDLGKRIAQTLAEPIMVQNTEVSVSASIGVALYPEHARNAAELLQKSDMAMYARKRDKKNGTQLFSPDIVDMARERHEIEQCIEQGLRDDWFDAALQPIVSLSDGHVIGFEALMRLTHPEKGSLSAAKVIGVAEENNAIVRIGDCMIEKSIAHLQRVSTLPGMRPTYLAINFSPLQLDVTLPTKVGRLLAHYEIDASRIVVEITEAVLMLDNPEILRTLNALIRIGCRIALDDFGTGYSSLSYLNRFPVNIVKVDQSFVRSLVNEAPDVRRKSRMLVKGIKTISHQMGYTVVAEGIETHEQWGQLKKMGLDSGQGYLFSRPQHIDDLMVLLRGNPDYRLAKV